MASGITSAPMRLAASHATTHSWPYGKYRPKRVPLPIPAASMRRARRPDSSSASRVRHVPVGGDDEVVVGPVGDRVVQRFADGGTEGHVGGCRRRCGHRVSSAATSPASTSRRRTSPGTMARSALPPTSGILMRKSPLIRRAARRVTGRGDGHGGVAVGTTAHAVGGETERARTGRHVDAQVLHPRELAPADDLLRDRIELTDVLVAQREPAHGAVDLVRDHVGPRQVGQVEQRLEPGVAHQRGDLLDRPHEVVLSLEVHARSLPHPPHQHASKLRTYAATSTQGTLDYRYSSGSGGESVPRESAM